MGLIKALTSSVSSGLGDQFKEFIECPAVDGHVLIQRGIVHHGDGNKNPSEGIITKGSAIVVPEGMAMMVIDNGAITEFVAEPGTFTYDNSTEPTVFDGGFFKGIGDTIKTIGRRITFGGQEAHDQRVYYVNTKVIMGNKFGSPQPKKITDEKYGMLEVTFFGEYAVRVVDPAILVSNVVGTNAKDTITFEDVVGTQLKAKFVEQITRAISYVMREKKVSFGDLGLYGGDISDEMNRCLDDSWKQQYGLMITDVALGDVNLTEESMKRVSKIDDAMIFSNPNLQSGLMATASADAMTAAASNTAGSMVGFMGMNMAGQAGANMMNAVNQNVTGPVTMPETGRPAPGEVFASAQPAQPATETPASEAAPTTSTPESASQPVTEPEAQPEATPAPKFCSNCGAKLTGRFCSNCGQEAK